LLQKIIEHNHKTVKVSIRNIRNISEKCDTQVRKGDAVHSANQEGVDRD
jgi:hypothetical protein